jgi:transcriptional regulator
VLTTEGLEASPIPWLLRQDIGELGALHGHVSRANPLWQVAVPGHEVLVVFALADAYVSPTMYPSKAEHGRVVPTWNYVAVHAHGSLVVHDDDAWCARLVRDLTARHESTQPRPWSVDDAPPDHVSAQLRGVVGLEVVLSRVEAKAKLSQNRTAADLDGVLRAHEQGSERARRLAAMMRAAPH